MATFAFAARCTFDGLGARRRPSTRSSTSRPTGLHLYASAEAGWDGTSSNYTTAHSKVIVLPIPLVANPTATVIDVPQLRVGWSIDVDATGMILSGISSTGVGTDGAAVRCTLASCPP